MSTVPNESTSCPAECRQNWQRASDPIEHVDHCPGRTGDPRTVPNILPTPVTPLCVVDSPNYCRTHEGIHPVDLEELRELLGCPDWCTCDHTSDDPADPIDNLILHTGDDHTDGTVRRLFEVHEGSKLDVRVARTDCPQEGTVGVPALLVRCDVELTTWEQAAELARTVLDGFGYLAGADQR